MNDTEPAFYDAILNAADAQNVRVEFIARGHIRLTAPLTLYFGRQLITIPAGFECDGASVPTIFWPIISHPFSGSSLKAALGHDYYCRTRTVESRIVHRWFYERLLYDKCAKIRARLMYLAVRWFGPRFIPSSQ